jgi:hypothetical protein
MNTVAGRTEAKILAIVHERGSILLEAILSCLPELTWNEVFTSVDKLSRRGAICLRRRGFDYELWSSSPPVAGPAESTITSSTARNDLFPDAA